MVTCSVPAALQLVVGVLVGVVGVQRRNESGAKTKQKESKYRYSEGYSPA
ncbi:UNVERIFIED_CONTAM: hypothetical protein FKN15_044906 [Acipenser sinensis]